MAALTLPDICAELARVAPHRFIWFAEAGLLRLSLVGLHDTGNPCYNVSTKSEDAWQLPMLQGAVQDECRARGWNWDVSNMRAQVFCVPDGEVHRATARTPAEALALALLAALEATP